MRSDRVGIVYAWRRSGFCHATVGRKCQTDAPRANGVVLVDAGPPVLGRSAGAYRAHDRSAVCTHRARPGQDASLGPGVVVSPSACAGHVGPRRWGIAASVFAAVQYPHMAACTQRHHHAGRAAACYAYAAAGRRRLGRAFIAGCMDTVLDTLGAPCARARRRGRFAGRCAAPAPPMDGAANAHPRPLDVRHGSRAL